MVSVSSLFINIFNLQTISLSFTSSVKGLLGVLFSIFIFGFLVFVHELGHFISAKKFGIQVNEFAIGMGPVLFKKVLGETQYSLRALPFGGYVSFEDDKELSNPRSLKNASVSKRFIVMVSGAIINIILGFILITALTFQQSSPATSQFATTTIDTFYENSVTNQWLEEGDKIIKVNGKTIRNYSDLNYNLSRDKDGVVDIVVERDAKTVDLNQVTFHQEEVAENYIITTVDFRVKYQPATFVLKVQNSFLLTKDVIRQIWGSLGDLLTGSVGIKQMSGPVGITKQVTESTNKGNWVYTILMIATISLNLGVLNLLPLPVLDGGKILLLLVEAIIKKPINENFEMVINLIGFVLIFGLMIIVSFNDIANLFKGS